MVSFERDRCDYTTRWDIRPGIRDGVMTYHAAKGHGQRSFVIPRLGDSPSESESLSSRVTLGGGSPLTALGSVPSPPTRGNIMMPVPVTVHELVRVLCLTIEKSSLVQPPRRTRTRMYDHLLDGYAVTLKLLNGKPPRAAFGLWPQACGS